MNEWFDKYDYSPAKPLDPAGGSVYRGLDKAKQEERAIKIQEIHPRWDDGRLERCYHRAIALSQPNLLPYTDFGRWQNETTTTYALAMPVVPQGSLAAKNPMEWGLQQKLDAMDAVLQALIYLHKQGLVCQTLSAEHILLSDTSPQLINYANSEKIPLAFFKNYEYLAPEQLEENAEISPKTDVWAVGVLMFWLWTGNMPFGKRTAQFPNQKIKERILSERPLPQTLNDLHSLIQKIIRGCLQRNPDERWANVESLYAVFSREKSELWDKTETLDETQAANTDKTIPLWRRRVKRTPSKPIPWYIILLALAAAMVAGYLLQGKW